MDEGRYKKEELKKSEKFKKMIDVIDALFEETREYTITEAEEIIVEFMKGRV